MMGQFCLIATIMPRVTLFLLFILRVTSDSIDYTPCNKAAEPKAYGEDVVDAALASIEESLSADSLDFDLTRRIALVESNFGNDQSVLENNLGGIWQVSQQIFSTLKSGVPSSTSASTMALEIRNTFGFEDFLTEFNFNSAIRSALGARLYIELKTGDDIPDTVEKQAQWWSDYYHDGGEKDTFVTKVNEYENAHPFDQKMDMWFMLDGGYDVDDQEWEESVNFTCSMASQCSVSQTDTQVGFSVYGEESHIEYAFENTTDYGDFETAAYATERPKPVSNCGAALDSVVDDQLSETGNQERRRDSNTIKQTVLVITDKKPSDNTSKPIEKMEEKNITSFCIGVGSALEDESSLETMATDDNLIWFSEFRYLVEPTYQKKIFNKFCGSQIVYSMSQLSLQNKVVKSNQRIISGPLFSVKSWRAYTRKETDMVCVLICVAYVNTMGSGMNATEVAALRKDIESVFNINCSSCRQYSSVEVLNITTQFERAVESGEKTGIILLLQAYASQRSSRSDATGASLVTIASASETTAAATTGAAADDEKALCGSDFKSDVWFLLSGSPTTSDEDFQYILDFTSTMASKFNVSSNNVQLGLSVYEKANEVLYGLDTPTNLTAFQNKNKEAKKASSKRNLGKGLEDTLENAFSSSRGARVDEEGVKKNIVVLITGNATDDVDNAKTLMDENNITVFAIGIGNNINTSLVNSLASEPKKKHALFVESFQNLNPALSQSILKTVDEAPIPSMKRRALRFSLKPGSRRQITTKLGKDKDLLMNVTSNEPTATLRVYVKVGKTLANSAVYDAMIILEKGGGRVAIEAEKLLANYPDLRGQEVTLSIAVVSDKQVEINIALDNDERTEEQKILDALEDLYVECSVSSPDEAVCTKELDMKLQKANNISIAEEKTKKYKDLLKQFKQEIVVTDLEELEKNCTDIITGRAECVQSLETFLKEAEVLEVAETVLAKFKRLARSLKQDMLVDEVRNLTAECKSATVNVSRCYDMLESKLKEADDMEIEIEVLQDSHDALLEYQRQNDPSTDYQSAVEDFAWLIALGVVAAVILSALLFLFIMKKKKRKDQVEPLEDEETSEIINMRENLRELTEEANKPDASYICMENLKSFLYEIDESFLTPEDLEASRVALESLEIRISQLRSHLKISAESAILPNATSLDIEGLQEQIALAESLQFPPEELEAARDALQRMITSPIGTCKTSEALPRSDSPSSSRRHSIAPGSREFSGRSGSYKSDGKSGSVHSAKSFKSPTSRRSTDTGKSAGSVREKSASVRTAKSTKSGVSAHSSNLVKTLEEIRSASIRAAQSGSISAHSASIRSATSASVRSAHSVKSGQSARSGGALAGIESKKSMSAHSPKSARSGNSSRNASPTKSLSNGENQDNISQPPASPKSGSEKGETSGKTSKAASASPRSRSPASPTSAKSPALISPVKSPASVRSRASATSAKSPASLTLAKSPAMISPTKSPASVRSQASAASAKSPAPSATGASRASPASAKSKSPSTKSHADEEE